MPVRVYPNKGKQALSEFQVGIICEKLNQSNHQWSVTYVYSSGGTLFSIVGATDEELLSAVAARCPGGQNTKIVS
jgi:hypothetical protein